MGRDFEVLVGEVVGVEAGAEPLAAEIALFGPDARVERRQAPDFSLLELRAEWARCFEQWLADTASSEKTLRAYTRAWNDLLMFLAAPGTEQPVADYWMVTHKHIRAWMADLAERPLDDRRVKTLQRRGSSRTRGYAQGTINQYLAAVSSFYSYAEHNWPVMLVDGREVALTLVSGMTLNPVRVIKRRGGAGGAAKQEQAYLSVEQLRQFLGAIPKGTLEGQRDRALFLFYILTGGRNSEVRTLQWGDFQERGGRMFWHWRGKGRGRKDSKDQWKELSPECWEALTQWLRLAGRLEGMTVEDYVFTAVRDNATNLPTVSAALWDPHAQPLSPNEVNRKVKGYAERAGLNPEEVHVHTLRHSAAMLMNEAGADLEELRKFLNHESLNTTQVYLHRMEGQRNVHAAKMAELLRL